MNPYCFVATAKMIHRVSFAKLSAHPHQMFLPAITIPVTPTIANTQEKSIIGRGGVVFRRML
jgi:hypothetical protein